MSRDVNPYGLRMPAELKQALEDLAHKNRRSLNAEIVARLENSINNNGALERAAADTKIYTVRPGDGLTTQEATQGETKHGIQRLALRAAIEAGEKYLEAKEIELSSDRRAIFFEILYDLAEDRQGLPQDINEKTLDKIFELAS